MPPTSDRGPPDPAKEEVRLNAVAEAWLPTTDPVARARILVILRQIAATGADPIAELRDGLHRWFGARAAVATPPDAPRPHTASDTSLLLEPLNRLRQPTLWPQRPKRLPDELFSSWLWRVSVAAGVPPRQFARQALGASCDDADHDVTPATLRRLAQLTGQKPGHLAGGLLQVMPEVTQDTASAMAETVLLLDGRFLLSRSGCDRSGRPHPVLQFCPLCLRGDGRPHFRRGWRLACNVICLEHGCRLQDRCWLCSRPLALLALRVSDPVPRCSFCDAILADGPVTAGRARLRQAALQEMLVYLAIHIPAPQRAPHLNALRLRLGSGVRGRASTREAVVEGLLPASMRLWFGKPADARHAEALQLLAEGVSYANLSTMVQPQSRLARRSLKARQVADSRKLFLHGVRTRGLPDYSETARTLTWKLIEGNREPIVENTRQGVQSADQKR